MASYPYLGIDQTVVDFAKLHGLRFARMHVWTSIVLLTIGAILLGVSMGLVKLA